MKPLPALTGFRFIAALYVFVFHIHIRVPFVTLPLFLQNIIKNGALGVNMFFVLSGFILTYSYYKKALNKTLNFKEFIIKRIAKIYPVYLFSLLCTLLVSFYFSEVPTINVFLLDLFMLEGSNYKLSMDWFGAGAWSLSNEMFFYLLFPVVILVLLKIKSKKVLIGILIMFILLASVPSIFAGFYNPGYYSEEMFRLVYAVPLFRITEFIAGMVSCLLFVRYGYKIKEFIVVGLLLIGALYLTKLGFLYRSFVIHNAAVLPAIIAFILLLANGEGYMSKLLSLKPLEYMGKISYSFFIMQIPLAFILDNLLKTNHVIKSAFYIFKIGLPLNLCVAVIAYELIEKPAHSFFLKSRV